MCELEAALPPHMQAYAAAGGSGDLNMATALPTIISHMHDYFVHVAAELEQLHNQVRIVSSAALTCTRLCGHDARTQVHACMPRRLLGYVDKLTCETDAGRALSTHIRRLAGPC